MLHILLFENTLICSNNNLCNNSQPNICDNLLATQPCLSFRAKFQNDLAPETYFDHSTTTTENLFKTTTNGLNFVNIEIS